MIPGTDGYRPEDIKDQDMLEMMHKIEKIRKIQSQKLPIFLKCMQIVKKHTNCMVTFINENPGGIPLQLEKIMIKGQNGINNYQKILKQIERVLQKNQMFLTNIIRCQEKMNSAKDLIEKQKESIKIFRVKKKGV